MEYIARINTESAEETIVLGRKIGRILKKGDFIAYTGDLGAGKTTITRGIAEGLGMKDDVTSPTFSIVNEYSGDIKLFHFDMYRIENENELEFTGFFDYSRDDGVFAVEWSENIRGALPPEAIKIDIKYTGENSRSITIRGDSRFENLRD